jgi:hypothetical protein
MRRKVAKNVRCTKCGSFDTRSSYSATFWGVVMMAMQRVPYRCRWCHSRFYLPAPHSPSQA